MTRKEYETMRADILAEVDAAEHARIAEVCYEQAVLNQRDGQPRVRLAPERLAGRP